MNLSQSTVALLGTLDSVSRGQLQRRDDLGTLLELGAAPERSTALDELAFRAKFLTRTFKIMQRIGSDGEGYGRLEMEFTASMDVARGHLRTLLVGASDEVRDRFTASYLAMTPAGLTDLMALLRDLTWYKNWLLDTGARRS